MDKAKPFYFRLSASARELLDKAATDMNISRAKVIDLCIIEHLRKKYSDVNSRVDQMLAGSK